MFLTLTAVLFFPLAQSVELPTAVWQVAPHVKAEFDGQKVPMQKTKTRAVILIHGLMLHPILVEKATRTELHDWQLAKNDLTKALAPDFDVYAFSYAQTTPVDVVASCPGLISFVQKVREAGYQEIILIGHSAGGVVCRQFVERYPKAGVTKVIQVAAPNGGSELAQISFGVPRLQASFVKSLAPPLRTTIAKESPPLPKDLEFCCVVCKLRGVQNDTLVTTESQWSPDLRKQGIPATLVLINHFEALKAPHAVSAINELAREKLVRWDETQTDQAREVLYGSDPDSAAIKHPQGKERPVLRILVKKFLDNKPK
jgi:hypothetical protein